jgi:hypothetical protein
MPMVNHPLLGPLGSFHQGCHKFQASLRCLPSVLGAAVIPKREVSYT